MLKILKAASYYDLESIRPAIETIIAHAIQGAQLASGQDQPPLVVLKPNWIQEGRPDNKDEWEALITHPALIALVAEIVLEQLSGRVRLSICDAPHTDANFEQIVSRGDLATRLRLVASKWRQAQVEILDLRKEVWVTKDSVVISRRENAPDPSGYVKVDLGTESLFYRHSGEDRYYGADYDTEEVRHHHRGSRQEYLLAGTPMAADLFINLPKLKTHKKTGITCCLKNLVGINGDKNWLPHHTEGSRNTGGDEFQKQSLARWFESSIKKKGQKLALKVPGLGTWVYRKMRGAGISVLGDSEEVIRNGNWWGNDTCWRMALDLNRALLHANRDGSWRGPGLRKPYLAIVDAITAGEGNGPLSADSVNCGLLIAGSDPAAVDAVCCRLMGFDPSRIPLVAHAFESHCWPIATAPMDEILVLDGRLGQEIPSAAVTTALGRAFIPHFGWRDHLDNG